MLSCTGNFKSKNKLMISKIHFIKRPMDVTNLNVILNVTVIWKYLESLTTENIYKQICCDQVLSYGNKVKTVMVNNSFNINKIKESLNSDGQQFL